MPEPKQPHTRRIVYVDYVPAEPQAMHGPNACTVFYYRIPGTNKMKRFRNRVRKMKSQRERERYAKKVCHAINKMLEQGWSPFLDGPVNKEFHTLAAAMKEFIGNCEAQTDRGQMRPETLRTYISQIKLLNGYLKHINEPQLFCSDFGKPFVRRYMDYVYYEKKRSPRTVNNYLRFCSQLANFLVEREYLAKNSVSQIPPMVQPKKTREIIDPMTRREIFAHLKKENRHYLTLCLIVYYCFVRRTEITKLKVLHVKLAAGVIEIPGSISKNKKDDVVTIPAALMPYLADHLNGAVNNDFLFGQHFKPGARGLQPKKISDTWAKMRDKLGFKKEYQFYSLKDTGITQLFHLGLPLIKIRDQARHHDIKITEGYTPRNYQRDNDIFNAGETF
ncbi:MAG: site-specific integrase [Leeuwenhoekiella sp.]